MKDINYYKIKENLYAITEQGQVYSKTKHCYMKTRLDKDGYVCLSLKNNNDKYSTFYIHRLIMIAYKPIDNMENLQINHIDGNKENNDLSNLEWCTCKENIHHAIKYNLNHNKGELHPRAILTEQQVKSIINDIKSQKISAKQIMNKYSIKKSCFYGIKHEINWKYLTIPAQVKQIILPR